MNNTQRVKLDAGNRVNAFNKKYETELSSIPEYAIERQTFDDAMTVINIAAQTQSAASGTHLDAVDLAKQKMANTTIKYALRAVVKAKQDGYLVLASSLDQPVSYILRSTKTEAVHRAKEMRDNMNSNLATLTNLSAINITEIDSAIAGYDGIKDNPTIDRQTKAATGTNPLPAAFGTVTQATDNMYNLVVSYYLDTNRPMVDEMALAKQIINTGLHHNGLDGIVTKDGLPVVGANITIDGSKKNAISNEDGHYTIAKIKTGQQNITVAHPDGSLKTKTTSISNGKMETMDFDF